MQNREPPGLPANETGAHTPYASSSIAGLALLVAPRHMATSDYLDMQMIRRAREREGRRGGRRIERDASPSLFLVDQCESCVHVCVCLEKGVCRPSRSPRGRTPPPPFSLKKPPTPCSPRRELIVGYRQEFACRRTFRRASANRVVLGFG